MPTEPPVRALHLAEGDVPLVGLDLVARPFPGHARLRVTGELDLATAPALDSRLQDLVRGGCRHLRLELSELTFCDVTGMSAFLHAARELRSLGGDLVLRDPPRSLRRILEALGFDERLAPRE